MADDTNLDRRFDSILRTQESKLERKLRAFFNRMSKDMQRAYLENGQIGADAVVSRSDAALAEILIEAYKNGVLAGSRFARRQVEEKNKKEEDSLAEEALLLLLALLAAEAIRTSQQINRTTQKLYLEITQSVAEAQAQIALKPNPEATGIRAIFGRGIDTNKEVAKRLKDRNYTRAKTIATTEAQNGIQNGIETSAEVMNQQALVVLKKTWQSQGDSKVRNSHARVNGQTLNIGEFFLVGRGRGKRPLARTLPVEEVANCRCYIKLSKHSIITEL